MAILLYSLALPYNWHILYLSTLKGLDTNRGPVLNARGAGLGVVVCQGGDTLDILLRLLYQIHVLNVDNLTTEIENLQNDHNNCTMVVEAETKCTLIPSLIQSFDILCNCLRPKHKMMDKPFVLVKSQGTELSKLGIGIFNVQGEIISSAF